MRDPWVALSPGFGAALKLGAHGSLELYAGMVASLARSRFERAHAYTISTLASELNFGPRLRC